MAQKHRKTNRLLVIAIMIALVSLLISPALVGAQAENGFDAEDGITISGTVDITGYADDPNFVRWDIFVLPGGSDSAKIWVASGSDAGEFSVSLDTSNFPDGDHALSLRIVKAPTYNYDEYLLNFTLDNAGAPAEEAATAEEEAAMAEEEAAPAEEAMVEEEAAPAEEAAPSGNGITAPEDGATVSGTVEVTGEATDPSFAKWQLDLLPGGNADQAIFLALGEEAGEFSYDLDSTLYPDGTHALRLRVVKSNSNYDEYTSELTIANAGAPAEEAEGADIVETAIAAGTFETLVAAVQAADLVDALQAAGPFTVFAPTEDAFAALPEGALDDLLADPEALANVLLYHVVSGEVMSSDLSDGLTAETLQGSEVTFAVSEDGVQVDGANVVQADIETSNGVIHVIDAVILPPAGTERAAAPVAPTATGNGFDAEDGITVSGTVDITGYAADPNFDKWQLDVLPGGNADQVIFVALGEEPGEFSVSLDTTNFPDGDHALRLRVVKSDSNYDEYTVAFTIANS